jgi:monovalent cation:H+ antiporter-2, CPA2 family
LWGWSVAAGIVLGLAISIASTVVLLRGLMDNGLLNTPHGQAAVGWLILEDIATVLILVLMPTLANTNGSFDWQALGATILKAGAFMLLILFVGRRLIPWLLLRIAHTRSRELFILAILAIALGTAMSAAELFGVSLALGAFVAGVVVSESPLSHQVGADVFPFREAFAVLFFVSIGMLVNPAYLLNNMGQVLALTALIVVGKYTVTLLLGFLFPWQARTALVVASGLSQIGEFSFILGQAGIMFGLLNRDQYSLILAGALLSIMVNPLMFRLITPTEKILQRFPRLWRVLDRHGPAPLPAEEKLNGHVVIVGYGRVGRHIVNLLEQMGIPGLVIDADAGRWTRTAGAASPPSTETRPTRRSSTTPASPAPALWSWQDLTKSTSELVVAAARDLAPDLPIIARATTEEGIKQLAELGAQDVIHPELEGGLEIVRHTLLTLGFPVHEIMRYVDAVRHDHYDLQVNTEEEHRLLHDLINASGKIEVTWMLLEADNLIIGQSLAQANLRARTGASVVAIMRGRELMANPKSSTIFEEGDRIGFIGDSEQVREVEKLFSEIETIETGVEWET